MDKSAYIETVPDSIEFSLPYIDGSGKRIQVSISGKKADVSIKDGGDGILVRVEDIEWLRQVLGDIQGILEMIPPTTNSTT